MKKLIIIFASGSLAMTMAAIITPIILTIQPVPTNTVTVTASNDGTVFPWYVLETSTNLTGTNWVDLETNYFIGAGSVVFTNVPVTASKQFFRVWAY